MTGDGLLTFRVPKNRPPTHPGRILATGFLEPHSVSVSAFAEHIGVSRVFLSLVVNGKRPIGAEMAMRLERATGVAAEEWLDHQLACDVFAARHSPKNETIRKIRRLKISEVA